MKTYMREIAKLYGVGIKFRNNFRGGYYENDKYKIIVGLKGDYINTFCHELSHYLLHKEGIDPLYYSKDMWKHPEKYLKRYRWALNCELRTDKRAKEVSKVWFPKNKFEGAYKLDSFHRGFMYGYLFSSCA